MGRKPIGDTAMTSAERMRLYRLRHGQPKPPRTAAAPPGMSEAMDRLNARVSELEAALRSRDVTIEKLRAKTTPERPKAGDWKDDPRTKGLRSEIKNLKAEVVHLRAREERDWVKAGGIPRVTFAAVVNCLHPDKPPPTEKQRSEACGLFTQWKQAQRFRADA